MTEEQIKQVRGLIQNEFSQRMSSELGDFKFQLGEHLAQSIQGAVKVTVNGKIDALSQDILHIKESIAPIILFFDNMSFSGRLVLWILKVIAMFGAAFGAVYAIFQVVKIK